MEDVAQGQHGLEKLQKHWLHAVIECLGFQYALVSLSIS